MSDEDNLEKLRQMSYQEIVIDGGMAFSHMISEFFGNRAGNFGLLSEIIDVKRKNMEWPMNYDENTSMVFSISASIDAMEFAAKEVIKCCEVMRTMVENPTSPEKTYRALHECMTDAVENIDGELQRLIASINNLNDDEE